MLTESRHAELRSTRRLIGSGVLNMRIHRFQALLACALAFCAQRAWAFLDKPYITPANPTSADVISVNIYGGGCDLADGGVVWPPPVTQQGNELTVLLTGAHEEDPEFCYFGVGTFTSPIGVYPPGAYALRVNWRYSAFSGWVTETLGVIPFTVAGGPSRQPIETPTLSITGLGSLLLVLSATALLSLQVRRV